MIVNNFNRLHPMKASHRRKGLLFLDQFGKFTFIDLYVMIFMAVSFYITISEQVQYIKNKNKIYLICFV